MAFAFHHWLIAHLIYKCFFFFFYLRPIENKAVLLSSFNDSFRSVWTGRVNLKLEGKHSADTLNVWPTGSWDTMRCPVLRNFCCCVSMRVSFFDIVAHILFFWSHRIWSGEMHHRGGRNESSNFKFHVSFRLRNHMNTLQHAFVFPNIWSIVTKKWNGYLFWMWLHTLH